MYVIILLFVLYTYIILLWNSLGGGGGSQCAPPPLYTTLEILSNTPALERDSLFTVLLWPHSLDQKFHFFKDYVLHFVLDGLVDMYIVVIHTLIN